MLPRRAARRELWFTSLAFTVAIVAIGYALQISNGHLNGAALVLLTFGLAVASVGIAGPIFPALEQRGRRIVITTAVVGLALQLVLMFQTAPGIYLKLPDPKLYFVYLGGVVLAAAIVALSALDIRPQVWLPMLAAVHFALGVWMIRMSPAPRIDVFHIQSAACEALWHGRNPYVDPYPDVYASPSGQNSAGRAVTRFGYPPLSYLCAVPGYLAGDVRYSHLAAMSLVALLFGLARPSQLSAMMAALFLFTPRSLFVLEQAWTEPFVLLFLAAVLFCKIRGYPKLVPILLGLLISSKQHLFLILPAIGLLTDASRFRWKEYGLLLAKSTAVAGAVTLPFALWNRAAFQRVFQFLTSSALPGALSYPAWFSQHGGPYVSPAFALLVSFLALCVSMWLLPRSPSGFAAATGMMYFVLFLLSVASFCNYYYMVMGMLSMAVASSEPSNAEKHSRPVSQESIAGAEMLET